MSRFNAENDHFDFDAGRDQDYASFIADGVLDTDAGPDLTMDPPQNQACDLTAAISSRKLSSSEIQAKVEDLLLALLSQGRRADILALTGEGPDVHAASIDDETRSEFSSLYSAACVANPALKWYAKLAKILAPTDFSANDDALNIKMSHKVFSKVIRPFLADFQEAHSESSPIVNAVLQISDQLETAEAEKTLSERTNCQEGRFPISENVEQHQFRPDEVDFITGPQDSDVSPQSQADLELEDDIFGNPEENMGGEHEAIFKISLLDLSNKAVADYVDSQNLESERIVSALKDQGFAPQRAHEIAGIVKYMKLDRHLQKQGAGSRGGDVDFKFKVK